MNQVEYNSGYNEQQQQHDNVQLFGSQQQNQQRQLPPQLPDHLKCGEVYTWLCAGELYAVECKLCEDRPLCPLSEFPQHMEVWHTDWTETNRALGEEVQYEDLTDEDQSDVDAYAEEEPNEDLYLSFTTEDSGLYEPDEEEVQEVHLQHHHHHLNDEEILEPFEQVLIEQEDNAIVNNAQINEDVEIEKIDEELTTTITHGENVNEQQQEKHQHKQVHNLPKSENINKTSTESEPQNDKSEERQKNRTDLRENDNEREHIKTKSKRNLKKKKDNKVENKKEDDLIDSLILEREVLNGNQNQKIIGNVNSTNTRRLSLRQSKRKTRETTTATKEKCKKENKEQLEKRESSEEKSIENNNKTKKRETSLTYTKRKTRNNCPQNKQQFNNVIQLTSEESKNLDNFEQKSIENLENPLNKQINNELQANNLDILEQSSMGNLEPQPQSSTKTMKISRNLAFKARKRNVRENSMAEKYYDKFLVNSDTKHYLKITKRNSRGSSLRTNNKKVKFDSTTTDIPDNSYGLEENLIQHEEKSSKSSINQSVKRQKRNTRAGKAKKEYEELNDEYVTKTENFCDLEENLMQNVEKTSNSLKATKRNTRASIAKEQLNKKSPDNFSDLEESLLQNVEKTSNSTQNKQKNKSSTSIKARKGVARENLTTTEERLNENNTSFTSNLDNFSNLQKNYASILDNFCDLEESLMENLGKSSNSNKSKIKNSNFSLRARKRSKINNSKEEQLNNEYTSNVNNFCDLEESLMGNLEKSLKTTKSKIKTSRRNKRENFKEAKELQNGAYSNLCDLEESLMENQTKSTNSKKNKISNNKLFLKSREKKQSEEQRPENFCDLENNLLQTNSAKCLNNISLRTIKRNRRENIVKKTKEWRKSTARKDNFILYSKKNQEKSLYNSKSKINYSNPSLRIRKRIVKANIKKATKQLYDSLLEKANIDINIYGLEKNYITSEMDNLKDSLGAQDITEREDQLSTFKNNENSLTTATEHETITSKYSLNSSLESCKQQRTDLFRSCKRKSPEISLNSLAYKAKLRKLSESSSDLERTTNCSTFLDTYSNTDQELLKTPQETNLKLNENSSDYDQHTYETMDIYDLLHSFGSSATSSYGTETTSYYSPASLTSDDISPNFNKPPPPPPPPSNAPLTSKSPKPQEEHFEFYAPKVRLTKHHIVQLITLYKEHRRLWDQSHPDYCEPQLCRHSWQDITDKWSAYCQQKFSITEVRIRICTLCQRYLKERERLELEGELDEGAKFQYYEEMQFLEQQKSLQKRRKLYDQQNDKVLEIYEHFPLLWHVSCYKLRQAKERAKAFQDISTALKLCNIHLSSVAVQNRIRSLRKCYRLEKIRYLHCQVEQTKFESNFKHYERMKYLSQHVDPYACRICGKIFENLTQYREHLETENHGSIVEEEDDEEEEERDNENNMEQDIIEEITDNSLNDESPHISTNLETTHLPTDEMAGITITPYETPQISPTETAHCSENPASVETSSNSELIFDSIPYTNEVILGNLSPAINEVLIYSTNSTNADPQLNSLQIEDQTIKEIIENATNNDCFTTQSLDNFINSVNIGEDIVLTEALPNNLMAMEMPNLIVQNEVIIDQTPDIDISNHGEENILNNETIVTNVLDTIQTNIEIPIEVDENQTTFDEENVVNTYQSIIEVPSVTDSSDSIVEYPNNVNSNQANFENHLALHSNQTIMVLSNVLQSSEINFENQYVTDSIQANLIMPNVIDAIQINFEDSENLEDSHQTNYDLENVADLIETNYEDQTIYGNQNTTDSNQTNFDNQEMEQFPRESNSTSPSPLVVNVQCADYSVDLKLDSDNDAKKPIYDDEQEISVTEADGLFARLSDDNIRKMIALYRKYPQIWNPNHLDYNSRNLRRQAWCSLTAEYATQVGRQFSWRTLHRKLTDYVKYYKKLKTEQEDYDELENKWMFYEDLRFLDDVIAVYDELQRSVHHRDNNFKIIGIYKSLPQLWDIKHFDFNKRPIKQRNIEIMCNRLQDEYSLQITPERLKNRLIELRTQYRSAKKQRLKCLKNQQIFTPEFEFYEALLFIDPHIDPLICEYCQMEFKKLTDYNLHVRKEHERKKVLKNYPLSLADHVEGSDHQLENVCHICGMKFTTRSNLIHHLQRHEGVKNYQCTICMKKFFAKHSLQIHIRSHTKECPFTCEKCGASFVSSSKLNQHVKRHSNRKDYACEYCPKEFFTAFERDRHTRRHLNIRDKVCAICGKSFVVGSSYYAHMMLHSDTKRFECDKCDMKFAQYAGLYKHKKRHHKT